MSGPGHALYVVSFFEDYKNRFVVSDHCHQPLLKKLSWCHTHTHTMVSFGTYVWCWARNLWMISRIGHFGTWESQRTMRMTSGTWRRRDGIFWDETWDHWVPGLARRLNQTQPVEHPWSFPPYDLCDMHIYIYTYVYVLYVSYHKWFATRMIYHS